jgi:WhiB family redox-sensing transcriptional regulator
MSWVEDWTVVAACRGMDPDELFVQGAAQNRAKTVCSGCPVRTECLADALDNRVEYGVWGGMTERERRALLRRRPEVRSWRQFLESAKEKYERNGEEVDPRFATATQAAIPRQRSEAGSFGRA